MYLYFIKTTGIRRSESSLKSVAHIGLVDDYLHKVDNCYSAICCLAISTISLFHSWQCHVLYE